MAKYTIELSKICDIYGYDEVKSWFMNYNPLHFITQKQWNAIQEYGVWSMERLADKILRHYWTREIGFETPALFKHYAEVFMNENMEVALLNIYSNSIEYNPFESVDFYIDETRTSRGSGNQTGEGTSNSNSTSNSSGLNVSSDTPQGQINKTDILNGKYASNTSANEASSGVNDTTNSSSSGQSSYEDEQSFSHHEHGNKGIMDSYQKLIIELRKTFIQVDTDIINKAGILFMGLY